jgi:betaine-homocysteine S-methyltransferase
MRLIGKEHLLEPLNLRALELAKEVAKEEGDLLVAGNVCNTTTYVHKDPASERDSKSMFDEQVRWAADAKVDLVIGETFDFIDEALIALRSIHAVGLPAVITFAIHRDGKTRCGRSAADACRILKDNGADVVGLNCARGPDTLLPLLREIRAAVPGHIAALPVGYRTTHDHPTFQSLSTDDKKYQDLDPHTCTRFDIAKFTREAVEIGVSYLGVCCGGAPHHIRAMSEALGRKPTSSQFTADLSKHFVFGNTQGLKDQAKDHWLKRKNEF